MGEPSCDLAIAWTLFRGESRDAFRSALGVDDATWALWKALITLAGHADPARAGRFRREVADILADHERRP